MAIETTGWGFSINKVELTDLSRLTPEETKEVNAWPEEDQKFLADNQYLIRIGEPLDNYDPLLSGFAKRLWSDFYNVTNGDNKSALRFYEKYGPMTSRLGPIDNLEGSTHAELFHWEVYIESLGAFFHHQKAFRRVVNLYKHRNNEAYLSRLLSDESTAKTFGDLRRFAYFRIAQDIDSNLRQLEHVIECQFASRVLPGIEGQPEEDQFRPRIIYHTLLEAIYWQFRNVVIEGNDLVDCKNPDCEAVFIPSHGNQDFHSPACKQRFNDKKRPPRKLKRKEGNHG